MIRLLLLLNGAFLAVSIYTISVSWSWIELVPIALFGASIVLIVASGSKFATRVLFYGNGIAAGLGSVLLLVALLGGLITYGPGALAVLLLLVPIAVLAANAVYARRSLLITP